MLQYMKKHVRWFLLPFAMIIVSFVFWGIGTNSGNSVQIIAEVGPYRIDGPTYWRAYERLRDFYRGIFKEQFSQEMIQSLDLKNRALDQLLEHRILLIAAAEHGIRVGVKELQDAIMSDTTFHRNGRFDRAVYLRTLELNRMTPSQYEANRREQIIADRMRRLIMASYAPLPTPAGDGGSAAGQDPEALNRQQKAYRAFIEGYKRRLRARGAFSVNYDLIS